MIQITFHEADLEALRSWRYHHPEPRIQLRLEARYVRSQGVANREIPRLGGISKASFPRDLHAYGTGGIEPLKPLEPRRPRSALPPHRATIEADFRQPPPTTVAEAAARIAALTGLTRQPTQGRQFLNRLGMRPRRVGVLPAKAAVAAPEVVKKPHWSLGSRKRRLASAPSSLWMPPSVCLPPWWG